MLLVLGVLSLPLVASVFDGEGAENWILPVQLLLMAVVGALVGDWSPSWPAGRDPRRAVVVGVLVGVGAAVLGLLIFFLLLNGLEGA